jgi:hypothetical protein
LAASLAVVRSGFGASDSESDPGVAFNSEMKVSTVVAISDVGMSSKLPSLRSNFLTPV